MVPQVCDSSTIDITVKLEHSSCHMSAHKEHNVSWWSKPGAFAPPWHVCPTVVDSHADGSLTKENVCIRTLDIEQVSEQLWITTIYMNRWKSHIEQLSACGWWLLQRLLSLIGQDRDLMWQLWIHPELARMMDNNRDAATKLMWCLSFTQVRNQTVIWMTRLNDTTTTMIGHGN